jgi:hypothetical protein
MVVVVIIIVIIILWPVSASELAERPTRIGLLFFFFLTPTPAPFMFHVLTEDDVSVRALVTATQTCISEGIHLEGTPFRKVLRQQNKAFCKRCVAGCGRSPCCLRGSTNVLQPHATAEVCETVRA